MKRFLPLIFIFIFALIYFIPRLLNLSQNIQFRSDQALHLLEVKQMVDSHQLRLIGPAVTSKTLNGRQFFIGSTYYYFLATLGLIFSWSPLNITFALIVFEFIFYAIFINYLRQHFGYFSSILVALVVSFSPYLIFHSFFFWNPHFLIPLSILFIIFRKNPYLSAFIWGLALSFHYSAIFWLIPFIIFRFNNHQFKFKTFLLSVLLFLCANLPFIFFELRHQFYNLKTILLILSHSSSSFELTPHYFVFSLLIFLIFFLLYLSQKTHLPFYLLLMIFLFFNDSASTLNYHGLNYPTQLKITQSIANNCPITKYNIASTNQGDTRAYDLRYLLTINHCSPDTVDNYPKDQTIFLIAPSSRPPLTESVWEISSFKPFKVNKTEKLNNDLFLYRLDKS
ncbi:MAG: hypothetical protein WC784_00770 [Candidatus Shapirobacteria bacterium]|jgi:hypothetical protein